MPFGGLILYVREKGEAMKKTADVGIFEFTGIETIEHTFYTSVPSVDDSVRKQYLEEVKDVVNRAF